VGVWDWYARRGRIPRRVWLLQYALPCLLVPWVAARLDWGLGLPLMGLVREDGALLSGPWGPLELLALMMTLVPAAACSVTRLHDTGHSAWFLLWHLLPILGSLLILVACLFWRGDSQPNRYGPTPPPFRRPRLPAPPAPSEAPA
jgi:uncharacterized membrane protein YhaH (DUF805 family)